MTYGQEFVLTLLTNNPSLARRADEAGINRVGLDLEILGKADRQAGRGAWISDHQFSQIAAVADALTNSQLFVRTNPIHPELGSEIDAYVEAGAEVLMLPFFKSAGEAAHFVDLVAGRAVVSLLVETPAAAMRLHDIARVEGIDEIHIGLNDMHLGMGLRSHFEVLVSDLLDTLAKIVADAGIAFGFGGVGRLDDDSLPIPADLVYSQYPRVSATRALVSRVFVGPDPEAIDLRHEVQCFRERMNYWHGKNIDVLNGTRELLRQKISERFAGLDWSQADLRSASVPA